MSVPFKMITFSFGRLYKFNIFMSECFLNMLNRIRTHVNPPVSRGGGVLSIFQTSHSHPTSVSPCVFRASPAGLFEGYTGLTQWQAVVTVPLLGRIPGTHGHPTVACQNVMVTGEDRWISRPHALHSRKVSVLLAQGKLLPVEWQAYTQVMIEHTATSTPNLSLPKCKRTYFLIML